MNSNHPSRFVEPDLSEARVTRLWLNVADRLEKRRPPMLRWLAVGVAALALAGGGLLLTRQFSGFGSPERAVLAEAKLETASDTLAVTLGDGSSVHLASRTRVEVHGNQPSSVALALHRGELVCDVPHREGRSFTVTAGGVEVRAVGTAFAVQLETEQVEVLVTEGRVAVERTSSEVLPASSQPADPIQAPAPAIVDAGRQMVVAREASARTKGLVAAELTASEIDARLAWRVPRLDFTRTPLAEAVPLINRHSRVRVTLGDSTVGSVRLSGILQADNIETLVRLLEAEHGVTAEWRGVGAVSYTHLTLPTNREV